jgi:putative NADH-flavin reductase
MKIALMSPSSAANTGSGSLGESPERIHRITTTVRDSSTLARLADLTAESAEVQAEESAAELPGEPVVVVSSVEVIAPSSTQLIAAVRNTGIERYLAVASAGRLEFVAGRNAGLSCYV